MRFSGNSTLARVLANEAFDMSRKELGEVPFKTSSFKDTHIRDLVREAAKKLGLKPAEIMSELQDKVKKIEEFKKYSPILYDTVAKNAVETAAFELVQHSSKSGKVKFDVPTFMKLVRMIELEHEQFFPLRAPGETNYIFSIDPILVPDDKPDKQKYNMVETAAATADGEFIFNRDFMQKLLDWAYLEGLVPRGKKYQSNGGPIPDAYAYIEFLIMHELLHYSYGDFSTGMRLGQYSQKVHNWAMDFRSNYMLVKNGYNQLPIGLFSDNINYDRQGRYDAMVKLVNDELAKLPNPLKDLFDKLSQMDKHPDQNQQGQHQQDKSQQGQKQDKNKDQGGSGSYTPNVGDVVKQNDTGALGRVTRVNPDGSVEVEPVQAGTV